MAEKNKNERAEEKASVLAGTSSLAPLEKVSDDEVASPLWLIALALQQVADGGAAGLVRDAVREQFRAIAVKDRTRLLFNQIVRMRDAAEVAVTTATEEMAASENRG